MNLVQSSALAATMIVTAFCGQYAYAIPRVVAELADAYAASHAAMTPNKQALADAYSYWFFSGFTHPVGGISTREDIAREAYTEGQAYWREHADERDAIFAEYGYVRVEREGVLSIGFERSCFIQAGSAEEWWFGSLGGEKWSDLRPGQPNPFDRARIRATGYLSSPGQYGHLGAYRRDFLVMSFAIMGP